MNNDAYIQEVEFRSSSFGAVQYIRIRRYDEAPMSWTEIWQVFNDSYPARWTIQVFPPQSELIDEANIYHLFILSERPFNVEIFNEYKET